MPYFITIADATEKFWTTLPNFIAVQIVAILCGFIIGWERESRGKPAGLRTIVLISLGSAIFVQISYFLTENFGDPSRVAAQIVTGIGFLGAGAILHHSERGYIAGLTTAASIWVTAAIGMVVGAQKYLFAILASIIVLFTLRSLRMIERQLFHSRHLETRLIFFQSKKGRTEWRIRGELEDHMLHPHEYSFKTWQEDSTKSTQILQLEFNPSNKNHRGFLADIAAWDEILEIRAEGGRNRAQPDSPH